MKLTLGPIVSDARGRFAGSVFSSWKGVPVLRRFQAPANPNSADQQEIRAIFANLTRLYAVQGTLFRAAWTSYATGKKFIARNAIIARNVAVLQGEADLTNLVFSPGDSSTLPAVSATYTPGVASIVVAVTAPTAPTGWTLAKACAVAIKSGDMGAAITYANLTPTEGSDATDPYSITLSGLATVLYRVGTFLEWTAPDGTTRYSASISGSATPT